MNVSYIVFYNSVDSDMETQRGLTAGRRWWCYSSSGLLCSRAHVFTTPHYYALIHHHCSPILPVRRCHYWPLGFEFCLDLCLNKNSFPLRGIKNSTVNPFRLRSGLLGERPSDFLSFTTALVF